MSSYDENREAARRRAIEALLFLEDILIDGLDSQVWQNMPDEEWPEPLIKPIMAWWCSKAGHDPMPDQCGMPNHEYCSVCGAITPGEWTRLQAELHAKEQ